ncbi:DUF7079 family protein [Collimonas arenae]|uniref:DUF7079 family protein n=1 Tax=Collimonas arenae TaxID=279058 RepID=UPI0007783F4C|nr:hypothetical protein [Collimonas arenae]
MEYMLSEQRREEAWEALSDAFVDNDICYERIAAQVSDIDPVQLQKIFFEEVAPYCVPNLMSPIPPIWSGFDKEKLIAGIRSMQEKNKHSVIANLRHKAFVLYLRRHFSTEWHAIRKKMTE